MYAAIPGLAITNAACTAADPYGATVRALRSSLLESVEQPALLGELVRCATLAANATTRSRGSSGYRPT